MPTNRPTEARLEAALRTVESANRCEVGAMLALYHCAKAILPDLIAEVREMREQAALEKCHHDIYGARVRPATLIVHPPKAKEARDAH